MDRFYSEIEKVLQSSQHEDLNLDEPYNLQIKLLGETHMKDIRNKERMILNRLDKPNYGVDDLLASDNSHQNSKEFSQKDTLENNSDLNTDWFYLGPVENSNQSLSENYSESSINVDEQFPWRVPYRVKKSTDKELYLMKIPSKIPDNLEKPPENAPKGMDLNNYYQDMIMCFRKNCLILSIILGEYKSI